MARRFDSPRRATAIGVLALACLGFALFLLLGDDGSEPERKLERSAIRVDSGETPTPAPAEPVSPAAGSGNGSQAPAKPKKPGAAPVGSPTDSSQGADRGDEPTSPPSGAEGTCPPEVTREECELFAQAAAAQGGSVVVNQARDCLKVMSRADCIEWLRQMQAAQAQQGDSYRPEDCLEHASREQCREFAEQMREASQ